MGVGYTTIMYEEESLSEGIADIAACRYDGIEMSLGKARAAGPEAIREQLEKYDLNLYLLMGEWLESDAAADRVADGASIAADLGAKFIGILPPKRGHVDDESLENWIAHVCNAAADANVTPLLHHHGATHIEQPDEIEAWLDRSPDNLELLWDTAHQYPYGEHYPEGNVTDGIDRFADDIAYVHLKDVDPGSSFSDNVTNLSSGEFTLGDVVHFFSTFTDLGEGCIDFKGVSDALDDIGYEGDITIEIENQTTDPLVHAKQNIDYWDRVSNNT